MTLAEKVNEVGLEVSSQAQNSDGGVPSLCIPALTLQDGPNGIATGHRGVTQLPASIGVAATFDVAAAYDYGQVLGSEARSQGIDAVQAPNLNIARLPNSGRIFEGYGEDPTLVSAMGVAEIQGIQSQGIMAEAKHLGAYTQETDRAGVNQTASMRALEEIYLPAFKAAVQQGDVTGLMCSMGELNGVNTCSDSLLYAILGSWGFAGFVRTDATAVPNSQIVQAFNNGLDLSKPSAAGVLLQAAEDGQLSMSRLNQAVLTILTAMFKFGLIEHPLTGNRHTQADVPAHAATALSVAEQSIVLLKNSDNILPLNKSSLHSVAIIGQDAGAHAMTSGFGSSHVAAPFAITPFDAITQWLKPGVRVSYSPGGPTEVDAAAALKQHIVHIPTEPRSPSTPAIRTAAQPGTGPGWYVWNQSIDPTRTGVYEFSIQSEGDVWMYLNGKPLIAERGIVNQIESWTASASLVSGRSYSLRVNWCSSVQLLPDRQQVIPVVEWDYVTPEIQQAVTAARNAQVAIVFVSDFTKEDADRPTLSLPSNEDALIEAVAAANPRTIVVLNTGGAVLMPWLSQVSAVLEAWYPGEEDGTAITAVLSGAFDPSGHLPVTFPRSDAASPMSNSELWPGVNEIVDMNDLDIGYRWYDVNGDSPLFPFGFGLSYTTFSLSGATVTQDGTGYQVTTTVKNDGSRTGTAVVQAYLTYPTAAQEPPYELKAFAQITLTPGESQAVNLDLPASAFQIYSGNEFGIVEGTYTVSLGQNEQDLSVKARITVGAQTVVTPPSGTEGIATEQGTILDVPVTAVKAIYNIAGVSSTVQASGIMIVSHTPHPVSFTCTVTLISSSGTRFQELVTAVEGAGSTWTTSKN
jgi:beta-glucosidase